MSGELLTVQAVSGLLGLHPKTVLRFIREGRIRASKVGKQYRVLRSDLNVFARGGETRAAIRARSTSVVDIEEADASLLERLSAVLLGATQARRPPDQPISLDIAHDPHRRSVKIIFVASPADGAMLLRLIDACLGGSA